jgi:L-ascorbate metabolism protein UlaG (beta-lactamase superfamily)
VLTDPVLARRIGPVSFMGPKRFHPAPATVEELPELDVVLVSHDHFDHLCRPTMEQLAKRRVPIVTALGVGMYLERYGVDPAAITELDWGERAEVGGMRFTATPSQHFSGRGLASRNRTLWASWVISAGATIVPFVIMPVHPVFRARYPQIRRWATITSTSASRSTRTNAWRDCAEA